MPSAYFTLFYLVAIQIYQLGEKKDLKTTQGSFRVWNVRCYSWRKPIIAETVKKVIILWWLLRFSKAFSPEVTTLPPKPKSQTGFKTATILGKDPPGHLVFDELKMTSFLLALGLIISVCWEHTAVNGGRGEQAETQRFGYQFISGHVWNKQTRFLNWLDFTMQTIFNRRFWSSDTVSSQNSPSFQAM